jgi:hypothetical protein
VASSCEHGKEFWNFIRGGEFLDELCDCQSLKGAVPSGLLRCVFMFSFKNILSGASVVPI